MMNWRECGQKQLWPLLRLNANIFLGESSEIAGLRADTNPGFSNVENC
jgi:hypothetical protein